ncbi:hypothetical protein Celaphus_00011905 [Cervus elaphus hippelaphus]|uniref:Uncharacterized protein n=1 Tax=Cervus elaphus hippelaphus TaxID=46360 RepID=A0A212CL32_CEREH|nr:hypothetical protein Celaphus_00011905 [Cervus elaphus hippelaphus]
MSGLRLMPVWSSNCQQISLERDYLLHQCCYSPHM